MVIGAGRDGRVIPDAWARWLCRVFVAGCAGGLVTLASAQGVAQFGGGVAERPAAGPPQRSLAEWLVRLQQASCMPSYIGTFVVSSLSGAMSSARIWHVCEDGVQMERVEALTGVPRSTFRRNAVVMTFLPEARVVKLDEREPGGMFPNLLGRGQDFPSADFYVARERGHARVAGFDADIVLLQPRDKWRFGYRIWSERRTGLVVKTQTLDSAGRVLEQSAFSELTLDAPVRADQLRQQMADTRDYRQIKAERVKTSAAAEGWRLKSVVSGFKSQNCYRRALPTASSLVQWIFSDGLATVSLFMEPFDRERHVREGVMVMGATHMLTRRLADQGLDWWVTAVGEVPSSTLDAFARALERTS